MAWSQGEHVALVGDTGTGKSFLESRLLLLRDWNILFRHADDPANHFVGFKRVKHVRDIHVLPRDNTGSFLLQPPDDMYSRAVEGQRLVDRAISEGGWTITWDELWYVENRLGLTQDVEELQTQGRKREISVVCGMQRPSRISRFALSQCTHLFAFRTEGRDTQTLAEAFTPRLKELIPDLAKFEFAYYNRASRELRRGYAQTLVQVLGE